MWERAARAERAVPRGQQPAQAAPALEGSRELLPGRLHGVFVDRNHALYAAIVQVSADYNRGKLVRKLARQTR